MDAHQIICEIFTFKEGLLSSVAHDLKLEVHPYRIEVLEQPFSLKAWFDPNQIRVRCAQQNGQDAPDLLSEKDKRKIEHNIQKDVLKSQRYPEIVFETLNVAFSEQKLPNSVSGRLLLCGVSKEIRSEVQVSESRAFSRFRILQPDFNIRPYQAMLGALKIKPEIWVRVQIPLQVFEPIENSGAEPNG